MQRLFSTFADGWPGTGLLIQRALVAAVVAHSFTSGAAKALHFPALLAQLFAAGAGLLLLIGLWTPIAGVGFMFAELWIGLLGVGDPWVAGILAVLGATIASIGPGAWSVDARLFGRKHIEISSR